MLSWDPKSKKGKELKQDRIRQAEARGMDVEAEKKRLKKTLKERADVLGNPIDWDDPKRKKAYVVVVECFEGRGANSWSGSRRKDGRRLKHVVWMCMLNWLGSKRVTREQTGYWVILLIGMSLRGKRL
jgi:hypothetical protein